jgi:YD repeat-containing protein
LKTRHAPEQDAGTTTTYNYNSDDTLFSVADARGATQTFGYNARRLVTGISYSAPAGITIPAAVSFTYDGLGNRTSMTDGMGSATYNYNQLSRMTSEARTLTGLTGSFTLTYAYNLAGELTSFTDPFGAQVGYNYDQTGRLSGVTGSGFASVTSYASNAQYRAWGALKSLAYGNSKTLAVGYNNALQATSYEVPGVLKKSYEYNTDGRLKFTQDQLTANSKFDRSYEYDHMGRVTKGLSGAEARGGAATDDRPYNETLSYDAMNHLTTLARRNWDRDDGSGP